MIDISAIDMKGFVYKGSCNCDGSYTEKWQRGDYQLKVKQGRFKIKKSGVTFQNWTPITQLQISIDNVALQS